MAYDDTATVSGSVVSIDNGADEVGAKSCVVTVRPTLTGTSEVVETQTGKNLAKFVNGYGIAGNGTIEPTATRCATIEPIPIIENVTYKVYVDNNRGFIIAIWNGNTLVRRKASISTGGTLDTSGGDRFYLCIYGAAGVTCTIETDKPRCYLSTETDTTYEPYIEPKTYSANLGRTIYGGTADIVNGVGTDNGKKYVLDGTQSVTMFNTTDANIKRFSVAIPNDSIVTTTDRDDIISDDLPTTTNAVTSTGGKGIHYRLNGSHNVIVCFGSDVSLSSISDFNNYVSENNIEIVYTVTTPTDFTFTGQTIETKLGANNFWSEQGDTELTYYKSGYGFTSATVNRLLSKNLLSSAEAETKSNNSVSITCDGNGKYTATGTATGGSANVTFTLKTPCTIKSGMYLHLMNSGAIGSVAITLQKQDNTTIYAPALSPANRIADLSSYAGQTIYSIRFYISNGATFEMSLTPMICFSSTATSYEPYVAPVSKTAKLHKVIYGGTADVVKGTCEPKNLLKLYLYRTSHLGVNFSLTDDGLLHMEGTNTSTTGSAFSGGNYSTYDDCPWKFSAGTYTASSIVSADLSKIGSVNLLIRTKSDNVQTTYYLKDAPKTFTVNEDFGAWFWASVLKTETVNCDVGVQLEKGSTASDFAPYFEPFTFPPISMSTDEGENTLFANEGDSAITYRKAVD